MNVCDIIHIQTRKLDRENVRIYWLNSSDVRGNLTEKKTDYDLWSYVILAVYVYWLLLLLLLLLVMFLFWVYCVVVN